MRKPRNREVNKPQSCSIGRAFRPWAASFFYTVVGIINVFDFRKPKEFLDSLRTLPFPIGAETKI
jgi:hypothetical protein